MIWLVCLCVMLHYGWQFIRGYRGIEEGKPGRIRGKLGLICTLILIVLSVYLLYETVQGLWWFQVLCRQLIEETFVEIFRQNSDACGKKIAYIIICSLDLHVVFKDACQFEYWLNFGYQETVKFLRWIGQQVMNATAVAGLYYAVFYEGDSLLLEKNKFLMVLVAFCAAELLLYDIFAFSTECSQKFGKKVAILRKADSLWEGINSAFLKDACPCPKRDGLCCCYEDVAREAEDKPVCAVSDKRASSAPKSDIFDLTIQKSDDKEASRTFVVVVTEKYGSAAE